MLFQRNVQLIGSTVGDWVAAGVTTHTNHVSACLCEVVVQP